MKSPNNLEDSKLLNILISDYIEYFNFILVKKEIINFISFDNVIKNDKAFIDVLAKTNNSLVKQSDYQKLQDILMNENLQTKQKKMSKEYSVKYSSTPNKTRTGLKKIIKEKIVAHHKINDAIALFENIENYNCQ